MCGLSPATKREKMSNGGLRWSLGKSKLLGNMVAAGQAAVVSENLGLALRASAALAWREVIRFLRQRHRVVGALGQPLLFWLLFGAGMHRSFRLDADSRMPFWQYYLPGTVLLVLLFTAIFATISIIEDRREGFLQGVLVAPVPRWVMVAGKLLGASLLAVGQALLLLALCAVWGIWLSPLGYLQAVLLLWVVSTAFGALGFVLAWRMDSTQGFHAVMNLVLMPMWLLSGAFFPVPAVEPGDLVQTGLHWVMRLNPVTYAVAGLRGMIYPGRLPEGFWEPHSAWVCWAVTVGFAAFWVLAAWRVAERPAAGDGL
ncbi:MAG: transport permease protein [Pirellulaceae bacterium]|nr:MAG: transport permease protein [Pirellulaceae bacterium]